MSFDLSDYTTVAEREELLFERYPEARIQVDLDDVRDEQGRIIAWKAKATIWRTADDPTPVIDYAVEPVPGKTPYTRDSEAMNASTSAVGRAIILAGFPSKKIASADEVRSRSAGGPSASQPSTETDPGTDGAEPSSPADSFPVPRASSANIAKIDALIQKVADHRGVTYNATRDGVEATYGPLPELKADRTHQLIRQLEKAAVAPVPVEA